MKLGFEIKEGFTEQWFSDDYAVFVDGKGVYNAETPFERTKCLLYVLRHPSIWFA